MRCSLLFAALLLGTAAPAAHACPPLDACLVHLKTTVPDAAPVQEPPPAERVAEVVRAPVQGPPRLFPGEVEMPWIWKSLREQVYSRMPTYEESNELKIVLAPVVVKSTDDTVPGLGIAGDF